MLASFTISTGAAQPAFADEFNAATLGPAWRARQGRWTVTGGVAAGRKDPASVHPAKLDLLRPQRDGVFEFSFKTDRPGGVDVYLNRGDVRVAVVQLRAEGLAFATYPKTKAVPSEPTYRARSEHGLAPDIWHTVRIERQGGVVRVQAGTGATLEIMDSGLEDEATTWMFNLRGPPEMVFSLDNVRATPAP